ncbi:MULTISPECIES: 2-methylaconitate cis-trans isomerase PrpF family protein [unclassified Variovorax]|uniref:2-methylaconitate cis-trans isomerase PrpF family protein n=1 Tax=unclassified Variovorax TaxID=663243 RepID=UPI001BD29EF7|nr:MULTISPECIES: PrpF domain-containing protein [unclassified Variovorax]
MAGETDGVLDSEQQTAVRCVLMRGGTSKALFFHERDLPAPGSARDRLLKRAMGTPDVMQIDGLGGARLVTSKVAIIRRSARDDADVDYTFGQIDVDRDGIGYDGNCGNISSAVGPFSIDEGLVEAVAPVTTVRIWNTNTKKHLVAKVQVANGKARVAGDCRIPGVPGSGAEILMDYTGTVGAATGRLLPTGEVIDRIALQDGRVVESTVCDVANPCVFVAAADLGLSGSELAPAISENAVLVATISEIQAKVGERLGFWADWTKIDRPGLPLMVIVAPPADYIDANSQIQPAKSMSLRARLVFLGKCHDSMAGTGSICTAAASRIPGSVVQRHIDSANIASESLRIGHPLGVMSVRVEAEPGASAAETRYRALGLARTARRLMAGEVYVPID